MSPVWPTRELVQPTVPVLLSIGMASMVGNSARLSSFTAGSAAWPAANRGYGIPFSLDKPYEVRRALLYNGATVSGNFDIGVLDRYGDRITSIGSTAQAGVSSIQQVAFGSPVTLDPGVYILALGINNTTATVFRTATPAALLSMAGMRQFDSFPIPATAPALAAMATDYLPVFGIASVDVI